MRLEVTPPVAELLQAQATRGASLVLADFGTWRIERQRPSAAPSLVVMGVSTGLSDQEVASRLMVGSKGLAPEDVRGGLAEMRVSRLRSKRRGASVGGAGAAGAPQAEGAEAGGSAGAESTPTRSVRVFLPPKLVEGFLRLGWMRLGGVVVRVREYSPPTAYCAVCKRMGSHDTASHRHVRRPGPAESPKEPAAST